jgi:hypothetical protein
MGSLRTIEEKQHVQMLSFVLHHGKSGPLETFDQRFALHFTPSSFLGGQFEDLSCFTA